MTKEREKLASGIFKLVEEILLLVEDGPTLSFLLFYLRNNDEGNVLYVYPTGKRIRRTGLVVPERYRVIMN